jgi:hypothetical protein
MEKGGKGGNLEVPEVVQAEKKGSKETTGNKLYEGVRGYTAISASEGS